MVRSHVRLIVRLSTMIRALDRRIDEVARTIPEARLLQTVPGIGPNRSLFICAEALPISRFATPGHFASYSGLVPRSSQSGERGTRRGPIPAGVNRWLRGALVRAVVTHAGSTPDSWLTRYYEEKKQRLGWPTARVAAARKLARALHAILRTGSGWKNDRERGELRVTHAA